MSFREDPHERQGTKARPLALLLFGATAAGKTALAVELGRRLPVEIVSADSRQVYRFLNIGTAKPTADERARVPHHLVDFLDLHETYDAARFSEDALSRCNAIRAQGHIPLIVGGAGFYLQVLQQGLFEAPYTRERLHQVRGELESWSLEALRRHLEELDPQRAGAIHPHDRYRLSRALEICLASGTSVTQLTAARRPLKRRFIGCWLTLPRSELHQRIAERTRSMFAQGWVEEVRGLLEGGVDPNCPGMASLGYPHVVAHIQQGLAHEIMCERIERDTRRYARHQETWFRKFAAARVLRSGAAENADLVELLLQPLLGA